jgi:hypothetical protein
VKVMNRYFAAGIALTWFLAAQAFQELALDFWIPAPRVWRMNFKPTCFRWIKRGRSWSAERSYFCLCRTPSLRFVMPGTFRLWRRSSLEALNGSLYFSAVLLINLLLITWFLHLARQWSVREGTGGADFSRAGTA